MPATTDDSLFWRIERACAALQYEVAASHARKGGVAVLMTNRKPTGAAEIERYYGTAAADRIREISTKLHAPD